MKLYHAVRHPWRLFFDRTIQLFKHPVFWIVTYIGNTLLILAAIAVYYLEREINPDIASLFDTIWWAFSTVTSVGYGDVVPVTIPGKLIGIALMILGSGVFACYTAVFAMLWMSPSVKQELAAIEERVEDEERQLASVIKQLESTLDSLKNQQLQKQKKG